MKRNATKKLIDFCKAFSIPVGLYLLVYIIAPNRFGSSQTAYNIIVQSIATTLIGYGMSFGWIAGLMDFTVMSRVATAAVVGGLLSFSFGLVGLLIGCMLASILFAAFTGALYRICRIPSFVISLGVLMIFEVLGIIFLRSYGQSTIVLSKETTILRHFPYNVLVLVITGLVFYLVYNRTKFAYEVKAVGGDETIAMRAGIKSMRVKVMTYIVGGVFLGIASVMQTTYTGLIAVQLDMGTLQLMFKPMMCIMIAIELERLCPLPIGIYLGAMCINIIFAGVVALGLDDAIQTISLGAFMIILMACSHNKEIIGAWIRKTVFAMTGRKKDLEIQ